MSETNELEQRRQEIIAHIKQVFPKNPRVKGKLRITQHSSSERNELREMLEGKQWIDIIGHPSIIYNFTDVDYLFTITDEAYLYYLPAFLTATMYPQGDLYTLANEKIRGLIPKFFLNRSKHSLRILSIKSNSCIILAIPFKIALSLSKMFC
jgi:hypothetical protein